MRDKLQRLTAAGIFAVVALYPVYAWAGASHEAKRSLEHLLLGKDVKALTQLPATKEGVDIYYTSPGGKDWDERGLNLKNLTKWLKDRGVGVDSNQVVTITNVKIHGDMVEVHLGGGGMGRRGSKHAQAKAPVQERAGGSRINFRYKRDITDADLEPKPFLDFMGRLLDVSELRNEAAMRDLSPDVRHAVEQKTVAEGMTYQMVLLSFGEPEQKKINDSSEGKLSETWFYMKNGQRWAIDFTNGTVSKGQKF